MSRKPFLAVVSAAGLAIAFAGCPGQNDASVEGRDTGPAAVINFPNHFSSVAHKCDGPNMVYQSDHGDSTRGGSSMAVTPDPRCPDYARYYGASAGR